ncbi:MAG: OmpA family protein [Nitrospiraceae bacterium]|nr:MAG: OmpA family protein [Nitrospiraceae bacterium]
MRLFIIVLSVIFLILSGIITLRALETPGYDFSYKDRQQPESQEPAPASQDKSEQFLREQATGNIEVEKLRAEISALEKKLAGEAIDSVTVTRQYSIDRKEKVIAVFGGGTFRSGQVVVNDSFIGSVNELVKSIASAPDDHVVIEGHTDNQPIKASGGLQYQENMDLSFIRAKAIARILVENGISDERISVIGYGDSRPIALNDTPEGREKNRRVEVKLIPGKKDL